MFWIIAKKGQRGKRHQNKKEMRESEEGNVTEYKLKKRGTIED